MQSPEFHDGKHGVEVFLEDTATALPITIASLKVDKYYFSDLRAFDKADSVDDATEIKKGVELDGVFGDPGHYLARQVQKDGIYGYRLYGTIDYFGVETIKVDTTVFCESDEGDTSKFNSDGWIGGYGCTERIEDTLFPEKNSNVNSGNGKLSFEAPANGAVMQQASMTTGNPGTAVVGPGSVAAAEMPSTNVLQLLTIAGLPAATVAGVLGVRRYRNRRLREL